MEDHSHIPDIVIRRLPIYARGLQRLQEAGQSAASSRELAEVTGSSAAQIRRDLSYFGGFGKQGKGYDVAYLLGAIRAILHLDGIWDVVVIGAGPLGQAIARYSGFEAQGFRITHVFDHNPERVGGRIDCLTVEDVVAMPSVVASEGIEVAILAVPAAAAQRVTDLLVASGIRAILNYAPATLRVPEHVRVQNIDPVAALQSLTYYLTPEPERV